MQRRVMTELVDTLILAEGAKEQAVPVRVGKLVAGPLISRADMMEMVEKLMAQGKAEAKAWCDTNKHGDFRGLRSFTSGANVLLGEDWTVEGIWTFAYQPHL